MGQKIQSGVCAKSTDHLRFAGNKPCNNASFRQLSTPRVLGILKGDSSCAVGLLSLVYMSVGSRFRHRPHTNQHRTKTSPAIHIATNAHSIAVSFAEDVSITSGGEVEVVGVQPSKLPSVP